MTTEPTDAEIVAVMRDGYNCRYNDEQDHIDFARAVLAKWGTPPAVAGEPVAKLWLWKNFIGGKPEYWAFDNPFPCVSVGGDPLTLGEPCGWALFKPSVNGRPQHSEQEVVNTVYRLHTTPQPTQAQAGAVPPIQWPKARDVGRIGDMSPSAHMRVGFDSDNDVFVSVWDERGGGSIEFCNPGGGGGGQSSRTRMALIALMVAMEADNAEKPSRDWWAIRMGGIKGGQHG